MTLLTLQQGIEAVQQGRKDEGARLIRFALKSDEVHGQTRAMGWLWLAETTDQRDEKLRCYNHAREADPDNPHVQERIALLMAQGLPPPANAQTSIAPPPPPGGAPNNAPPPAAPGVAPHTRPGLSPARASGTQPAANPNTLYRTAGILDGVTDPATGFFINQSGLLVTTRKVIGGLREITIELKPGQRFIGQVVRSFPEFDLALIHTGMTLAHVLPISNVPITDNTPLSAIAHNGRVLNGSYRATRSVIKQEWFPTTIPAENLPDAGGNPIFNDKNLLVGMLTHNTSRATPYVFGLHIAAILHQVETYSEEIQTLQNPVYCAACGHLARAANFGGFYCEWCGSVLITATDAQRFPIPQMASLYGETMSRPCPNCGSTVGFHNGACLRCGASHQR